MPPSKRGPYYYRRPDRPGLWAYLDRKNRNIPLEVDNEEDAPRALADLIESRKVPAVPKGDTKSIEEIFKITVERSHTNDSDRYAYDVGLDLERILGFLQGVTPDAEGNPVARNIVYPSELSKNIVEEYKAYRRRSSTRRKRDADGNLVRVKVLSERSVNREFSSWRKAMLVATEPDLGCLSVEQVDSWFERLKEPMVEPHQRGLSREELDLFMAKLLDWRWNAVFRTFIGSAMRDGELRHMDASDIHEGAKPYIAVTPKPPGWCICHPKGWKTKGWRYRRIPVTMETIRAAREVLRARTLKVAEPEEPASLVIARARSNARLSVTELAQRAGCSSRMLYHFEAGTKLPTHHRCTRLEEALGLPPETIPRQSEWDKFKLNSKTIWRKLQHTRKAAGLARFSVHDLRRAWASHMMKAGHALLSISKWLGHRDVQTTLRYLRIVDDDLPEPSTLPF